MKQGLLSTPHCEVCETPLQILRDRKAPSVCKSPECIRLLKFKESMPSTQYKSFFEFQKKIILNKQKQIKENRSLGELLQKERIVQDEQLLANALEKYPELDENTLLVNIATGRTKTGPLDHGRLDEYMLHLIDVIYEAFDTDHPDLVLDPKNDIAQDELELTDEIRDISDRACTMCKGGCCPAGKNTGYISPQTILRFKQSQPEMTEEDIFTAYLEQVTFETIEKSCINQTSMGCALPRQMRSFTCNIYHCDPLRKFQNFALRGKTATEALVIQRPFSNWDKNKKTSKKIADQAIIRENNTKHIEPLT